MKEISQYETIKKDRKDLPKLTEEEFCDMLLKRSDELCANCDGHCTQEMPYLRLVKQDGKLVHKVCEKRIGSKLGGIDIELYNDLIVDSGNRKELLEYAKCGKSAYIHGDSSVGKTYLLANIAKYWLKKGKQVYIDLDSTIRKEVKDFDRYPHLLSKLQKIDVLCIDDLGMGKVTEHDVYDTIAPLLQHRLDNQLTTYITTNYNVLELVKLLSSKSDRVTANRLYERLRDKKNIKIFELKDKNYRR